MEIINDRGAEILTFNVRDLDGSLPEYAERFPHLTVDQRNALLGTALADFAKTFGIVGIKYDDGHYDYLVPRDRPQA